jgi:hypothetical protein
MIFMIMALVILVVIALWNFDLHKTLRIKNITQNAGDSAAVMAARWQGLSLNLIGDLNLMKALALASDDAVTIDAIDNLQARLCYTGPMVALHASQQAAKNNGIFPNDEYSDFLFEHANMVRTEYTARVGPGGTMLFPEPYPGAWPEYADMIELAASEGIAAGPDTMRLYGDSLGGHILYATDFYHAVAGRSWCWFLNHGDNLLEAYRNFFPCWWTDLPSPGSHHFMNSEFFGLGLTKRTTSLDSFREHGLQDLDALAQEREFDPATLNNKSWTNSATWYCYGSSWGDWDAMSMEGPWPMPLAGPVKPQYNYSGADAAVRLEATSERITPGPDGSTLNNTITWTAAAKPFGYLNEKDRPHTFELVLPAFRSARLIPVDASSAPSGGGFNLAWREHVDIHLPDYVRNGPRQRGCWYCSQLVTWENPAFRRAGVIWLMYNSDKCTIPAGPSGPGGGGGGGGGGGRRRGH